MLQIFRRYFDATESPFVVSSADDLKIIPGRDERVIEEEEAFNITCQLTLTDRDVLAQEIKCPAISTTRIKN